MTRSLGDVIGKDEDIYSDDETVMSFIFDMNSNEVSKNLFNIYANNFFFLKIVWFVV